MSVASLLFHSLAVPWFSCGVCLPCLLFVCLAFAAQLQVWLFALFEEVASLEKTRLALHT